MSADIYRQWINCLASDIENEETLRRIYYLVERLWRKETSPVLDDPAFAEMS